LLNSFLTLNSCHVFSSSVRSKVYALPGLRIGWLATKNEALMKRVKELRDYTTICNSAPSEILALMGLRASDRIISRNMQVRPPVSSLEHVPLLQHVSLFEHSA
jgi:aspartate/methionine/tyrosine aminotransferase